LKIFVVKLSQQQIDHNYIPQKINITFILHKDCL
jgi:hypothetical protein